jgi:hypothetical protein
MVFCACRKPIIHSDIPKIKLISFAKYKDSLVVGGATIEKIDGGVLTFYFQDGCGDIGLGNEDSALYNLYIDYYEKQNGVFEKIDSTETKDGMKPFILHARFPRLSKLPEESIHGEITHIMPTYYISSPFDTILLRFFIVDRKFNESNVEEIITTKGF